MNELTAINVLPALVLCGVAGMVGQGIRAVVGLNKAGDFQADKLEHFHFNAPYLLVTLMIGFIAGCMSGLIIGIEDFIHQLQIDKLFAVISAGYAGVDFIEGSLNLLINKVAPDRQSSSVNAGKEAETNPAIPPSTGSAGSLSNKQIPAKKAKDNADIDKLSHALHQLNSGIDVQLWAPILVQYFAEYDFTTSRRKAAAIGQFMVEAGCDLSQLEENLDYASAQHIMLIYGKHFKNEQEAKLFCHQPEKLANRVYANRMGNGSEASGEGYRYRGRGLIQLTGKNLYQKFAQEKNITLDSVTTYCSTQQGAADSACWYLKNNDCLSLADRWDLIGITRRVNGWEATGEDKRFELTEKLLNILNAD